MKKSTKQKLIQSIRMIVLVSGILILCYPSFSNYLNEKNSSHVIYEYDKTLASLSQEEKNKRLEEAYAYNETLRNKQVIQDAFTSPKETESVYQQVFDMDGNGMMGYLSIPKIQVELPIYHGTSESILQVGIGHLEGSSLPVGGEQTHAILTGHRGLPSATLFTDLDQLVKGDIFYIRVLEEKLAYQVDQIQVVLPHETEALSIVQGEDLVTLVTCTPYAVNTHRLLVRGKRIPYETAIQLQEDVKKAVHLPFEIWMLLGGCLTLFVIGIVYRSKKRKEQGYEKQK